METQKDYIIRKLKSDLFNRSTIAKQVDISRDTLCRIENGTTKNPGNRTIEVLFNYFKKVNE